MSNRSDPIQSGPEIWYNLHLVRHREVILERQKSTPNLGAVNPEPGRDLFRKLLRRWAYRGNLKLRPRQILGESRGDSEDGADDEKLFRCLHTVQSIAASEPGYHVIGDIRVTTGESRWRGANAVNL